MTLAQRAADPWVQEQADAHLRRVDAPDQTDGLEHRDSSGGDDADEAVQPPQTAAGPA